MHKLQYGVNLNDIELLKALNNANHRLGQLNGAIRMLPNPYVLFNAISLGEAKESCEIENIVTTFDEIFKEMSNSKSEPSSKEVISCRQAMLTWYELVKDNSFISLNHILKIHSIIEPGTGDLRRHPGTLIMNTKTKEPVHIPPQSIEEIEEHLSNLERYINIPELEDIDPILKMAIIHFQFESIHPFYDGNGRTGRILNILYLSLSRKLDIPILYLSRYINQHREEYYACLNSVQEDIGNLKDYLLFMITGVEKISEFTLNFIESFIDIMNTAKVLIQKRCPKLYSEELAEHIFYAFYTKNEFICEKLGVSRNTASKYLHELTSAGILIEEKVGKTKIYKNSFLYHIIEIWE